MSRNKNKGKPSRPQPNQKKQLTVVEAVAHSEELLVEAQIASEEAGVEPTIEPSKPVNANVEDLRGAVKDALDAKSTFDSVRTELQARLQDVEHREADAESRSQTIDQRTKALDRQEIDITERDERLVDERAEIDRRLAEAEAGFLSRRDEILGPVQTKIAELTSGWHEQETEMLREWNERLRARRNELEEQQRVQVAEIDEAAANLNNERTEVARERQRLDNERRELSFQQEHLNDERAEADRAIDQAAAIARTDAEKELMQVKSSRDRLHVRIDELNEQVAVLDEVRRISGDSPEALIDDRIRLQDQVQLLKQDLATRPTSDVNDQLTQAQQSAAQSRHDLDESVRIQRELQSQLDYQAARLEELDQLKLTKEALDSSISAYRVEIEELRDQFNQLRNDRDVQTAFPECSKMDAKFAGKAAPEGRKVDDLEELVDELRLRMAHDPDAAKNGHQLNYRLSDVRIFLAGLAMSRLHLLEGVSGTGKTTLPHAFATAIGGNARKVEVQAGWRDKQDLLGYFNSFERIYRETPCLQYLYKASLPFFRDQLIIVVLDEMNLSHPEQYFADFLSALEDPRAEAQISIADRGLPQVPQHFAERVGVQLVLPKNVWFVGTANQDETTFAFAPKVYDRAHVMELEPNAPAVQGSKPGSKPEPISVESLRAAFDDAAMNFQRDTTRAQEFVDGLADFFRDEFRVSWGNRLNSHISRFVPVDIAAGGSLGEALDHIVATKVLQKIKGRHSIRPEALEELSEHLSNSWIDPVYGPDRSQRVIQDQLSELGFG